MRHPIALMLLIAVLVPVSRAALAQTQPPQAPPTDPARFNIEIVVTPERGETPRSLVPASTVVLDGESLRALPVVHPSEVVSFLPGFNVARPQFHVGRPVVSARGFFGGGEAEYVLLLVDGVPVSDVESDLIDWSVIPSSSIRRIEAFRGPGAALYGDSAVGGVVQILTNRPAGGGQLTATGGSFMTFTADGSFGRRVRRGGFNVSGVARRTDGGFDRSGGQQVVGSGGADGAFRGFSWRWHATGDERDRDDPGVLSREQLSDDPYASDPIYNRTWGAFLDDAGAYAIDGPSTLDFRVRRPVGRQALLLDVLNVTGHVYEEYGFTLADFRGGDVPYAYPGAPRAVRAGLTISF